MSDPLLGVVFGLGIVVSLCFSWLLVTRLERVGARMGLSEGLLGMLAALAADAPEITAAVTALARNDQRVGAGVVIGSNVFNLAALLGLSAVVAGQIALHRRVVELGGAVAMWIAAVCLLVVTGVLSPLLGLLLAVAALGPYVVILGTDHERLARLRLPSAWTRWLTAAVQRGGGRARGRYTSSPWRCSRCPHGSCRRSGRGWREHRDGAVGHRAGDAPRDLRNRRRRAHPRRGHQPSQRRRGGLSRGTRERGRDAQHCAQQQRTECRGWAAAAHRDSRTGAAIR